MEEYNTCSMLILKIKHLPFAVKRSKSTYSGVRFNYTCSTCLFENYA